MLLTVNKMTYINFLLRYELAVMHETKDLVHGPHVSDRKWMHHGCVSNVRLEVQSPPRASRSRTEL